MMRKVILSREQVKSLLNDLDRIEGADEKLGFSRKERAAAQKLLTTPIKSREGKVIALVKNRQSITAISFDRFVFELRKAYRELPEFREVCSPKITLRENVYDKGLDWHVGGGFTFSLDTKACDTMVYSLLMTIHEGDNEFEVMMERVPGKIRYQPLEETSEDWMRPNLRFPYKGINPLPMPAFPYDPFPLPRLELNPWLSFDVDLFPSLKDMILEFPPKEYLDLWVNPWFLPGLHLGYFQDLTFENPIEFRDLSVNCDTDTSDPILGEPEILSSSRKATGPPRGIDLKDSDDRPVEDLFNVSVREFLSFQ